MTTGFGFAPLISLVIRGHSRFCWQAIENVVTSMSSINFHDIRRGTVDQYVGGRAIGSVATDHASLALRSRRTL
jgi:hypothetical protein